MVPRLPSGLPSGRQFEIASGALDAVVTEVGAALHSLTICDQELLDTFAADEMAHGGRGQLLVPWPGRIAGGRYTFDGEHNQLPINEVSKGNAIHGLVRWLPWTPVAHTDDSVTLHCTLYPQPGYPFMLHLEQVYTAQPQRLDVRTTARNLGSGPLPYGVGQHPYFTLGMPRIDELALQLPARSYLRTDERDIPQPPPVPVDGTSFDFRTPRQIGSLALDTCFTDLTFTDGWAHVSLTARNSPLAITIALDSSHAFVMIYTGDTLDDVPQRRAGISVEPYTCAPNAFNNGYGLRVLQPGESFSCAWSILLSSP